jgi:secreted trypsin-like serine protease
MLIKNTTVQILLAMGILFTFNGPVAAEPTPRIVGGILAPNHAYPFMAAIEFTSDNFQFCGGTLIAPTKVLTAAHCLDTSEPVHVRIGTNNRVIDPGQIVSVISQVSHPKFNPNTLDYDVAVFTLAAPVVLNDNKNLMKLPEACTSLLCITGLAKPATLVRTAGWGATNPNNPNGSASIDLRQVDVPLVDNTTCNTAVGPGVTSRMICAGFAVGGKDSCNGDSGGPLFGYLGIARTGLQTGIVSWGVGNCGDPGTYGVYTRISNPEVRLFIRQQSGK